MGEKGREGRGREGKEIGGDQMDKEDRKRKA